MEWTERKATLGLILAVSLGIGTLFLLTGAFVLTALFEFLGLITIALGWLVLAPAYYFRTRPTGETDRATGEGRRDDPSEEATDPVEILRRRYAAGELSESEFERALERLLETDERASDARDGPVDELDCDFEPDRDLERE